MVMQMLQNHSGEEIDFEERKSKPGPRQNKFGPKKQSSSNKPQAMQARKPLAGSPTR